MWLKSIYLLYESEYGIDAQAVVLDDNPEVHLDLDSERELYPTSMSLALSWKEARGGSASVRKP